MKDIFKEMEELRAKLDELSAYAEKECKKPKMFPQEGERYCYYNWEGNVTFTYTNNSNGRLNVYKTKEEAEKARDIQWAKQRVAHAIAVENEGWKAYWNDIKQFKYIICLNKGLTIDRYWSTKVQPTWMYIKSREVAEKILAEHKADLLLILGE